MFRDGIIKGFRSEIRIRGLGSTIIITIHTSKSIPVLFENT